MRPQHTPGPWFVGAQNDALFIIDRRPAFSNDYPNHDADTEVIAKVYDDVRGNAGAGRCNARLIAAAPESIEANKTALMVLCALQNANDWHPNMEKDIAFAIDGCRAAVAKSTGEQP